MTYKEYVDILHKYMEEIGITDADFKVYNNDLNDKIINAMYKRVLDHYAKDAIGIKNAITDNKNYFVKYTNGLRE